MMSKDLSFASKAYLLQMISFQTYNKRGVANDSYIRSVNHLIKAYMLQSFALLEPNDTSLKVDDYMRKFICHGAISNDRGRICFQGENVINIIILSHLGPHITAQVVQGSQSIVVTGIYASFDPIRRKDLWRELSQHNQVCPWQVFGDFNIVSSQDEKLGGNPITFQEVYEFNQMIETNGLSDAGYTGNKFTWSNSRAGNAKILERMDRLLFSTNWMSSFITKVSHLDRNCSDHVPLLTDVLLYGKK